jgi:crotonobetainyl-CoA:carnitine CoA-transferase CaiB-like acyl-CoA transferase
MSGAPPERGSALPLDGVRVLDFTNLLPGPLATLLLAEAGASVVKVERREGGDPARLNRPAQDGMSVQFALLNRGKRSIAVDLKDAADHAAVLALAAQADVLVEQFRPGVMERLGLGPAALRAGNPRLVYCSITGFGQDGPLAQVASHDAAYLARSGMLSLTDDGSGAPTLPCGQIADIGGGSLPAVINILLALMQARATGQGCHLDVAMTENVLGWMPRHLAPLLVGAPGPVPGKGRHTGGSPRYAIYRSADGVAFAAAPLEEKFWRRFCALLGLPPALIDDSADPEATRAGVAACFARRTAAEWEALFTGEDVCVERVRRVDEALTDPHFVARGVFDRRTRIGAVALPALPVPLARAMRDATERPAPHLGEARADDPGLWHRGAP